MIRPKKLPADPNKRAKIIGDLATGQVEPNEQDKGKNPAAVQLGRLGGLRGGTARAKKLSAKRRKEIAKKAAKTRWAKKRN